jgi:hypothetical protein
VLVNKQVNGRSALEVSVVLKRAEVTLDAIRKLLLPHANKDFQVLQLKEPDKKSWMVGKEAMVTKYSPRCSWTWPAEIVKLQTELNAKMEQAKATKAATKNTPTVNPETNCLFQINLTG